MKEPTEEELRQAEAKRKLEERFAKAKAAQNASQGDNSGANNQGNPDGVPNAPQEKSLGKVLLESHSTLVAEE